MKKTEAYKLSQLAKRVFIIESQKKVLLSYLYEHYRIQNVDKDFVYISLKDNDSHDIIQKIAPLLTRNRLIIDKGILKVGLDF